VYKYAYLPSVPSTRYEHSHAGFVMMMSSSQNNMRNMCVRKFGSVFICEKIILAVNYVMPMRVDWQCGGGGSF
jgi:hypothetical protein